MHHHEHMFAYPADRIGRGLSHQGPVARLLHGICGQKPADAPDVDERDALATEA